MFTVLLLAAFNSNAFALPAYAPTSTLSPSASLVARDAAVCICQQGVSTRTLVAIIQSCLLTTAACVYRSIHPNILDPNSGHVQVMRYRLVITLFMILFPELIIYWAMQQLLGARQIAKDFNELDIVPKLGWTTTHGHIAQMGGFGRKVEVKVKGKARGKVEGKAEVHQKAVVSPQAQIDLEGESVAVEAKTETNTKEMVEILKAFTPTELLGAIQRGEVDPDDLRMTEQDLQDHSKGDILSKGLLILQTSWFMMQSLARLVQHLFLTEFEVVTLAFAVLNIVTYFFWWSKPLNVRTIHPLTIRTPPSHYQPITHRGIPTKSFKEKVWGIIHWIRNGLAEVWSALKGLGSWLVRKTLYDVAQEFKDAIVTFFRSLKELIDLDEAIDHHSKNQDSSHIGRFYRYPTERWKSHIATAVFIGTVFGGIHFISWYSIFPTPFERVLWRITTTLSTAYPAALLIVGAARYQFFPSKPANPDQRFDSTLTQLSKPI